jgi:predicted nucleic acid-binding protein
MVATDLLPAIDVVKSDPTHNVYLATALAGGARWVVTGNTRHLTPLDGYAGLRITVPSVFLAELDAQADLP